MFQILSSLLSDLSTYFSKYLSILYFVLELHLIVGFRSQDHNLPLLGNHSLASSSLSQFTICYDLPNVYWERKQHVVYLSYKNDFREKHVPTKSSPIQMNK